MAGVVLGTAALPVVLPLSFGAASASTLNGEATITNQTLSPLSSGASSTEFSVALSPNGATPASCTGDSASGGYHVYSYLVQAGTTISSLTFSRYPSTGLGLVNNVGVYYGSANTAIHSGQIVGIPTNFEFAELLSDGESLSSLLYSGTTGVWEAGIACANSSGTLTDYWNVPVTFTSSGSDPNGFVWSAYQVTPTTASTTTPGSSTYTGQLSAANASGPVTYTVTGSSSSVNVSSSGAISTTGTLQAGSYTVSGTDSDTGGDSGPWSFTLTVPLTQASPTSASTTTSASSGFTDQLAVSNGGAGSVTYTVQVPATGIAVSSSGAISITGTLAAGSYTVSGTDGEANGANGTWSFKLTVAAVTLNQAAPTAATVAYSAPTNFSDQLSVSNGNGAVSYAVTSPATGIVVASSGAISTTGTLAAGSYTMSGTDRDVDGDSGTWSFTLTVGPPATDSFTTPDSAQATVGASFTFHVTTNPIATKLKSSGKLPKGVKFNKSAHEYTGTPTASKKKSPAGTYHLTLTATFGKGKTKTTATQAFTLIVES